MKDILDKFRLGRHEFENGRLDGIHGVDPYLLFEDWMREAVTVQEKEANAFVLSTVGEEQEVSSRIVYLKDIIDASFVFYTNYHSKKGKDIAINSKVSMLFFWPTTSRQIRIEGICTKVNEQLSDEYFASRPRPSQIGAWASFQSDSLMDSSELENRIKEIESTYEGQDIPRPPHWGGYGILPFRIEFWQGRPSRLHDRFVFEKDGENWRVAKLNP